MITAINARRHLDFVTIFGNDECMLSFKDFTKSHEFRDLNARKKYKRIRNEVDGLVFKTKQQVKEHYKIRRREVDLGFFNNPDNKFEWLKLSTVWE